MHPESKPASATAKVVREKVPGERGIYRRVTADGRVRHEIAYLDRTGKQRWETVGHKLSDAKRRRAELISKRPDERHAPSRETFADVAALWLDQKRTKLRASTLYEYRAALRLVLLPRFGRMRLALIDADEISALIRDLEREGLHCVDPARPVRPLGWSSVKSYTKPLQGVLGYAARRGWIPVSPFSIMTADDRPTRGEERKRHEWTSGEVASLLEASKRLAETKATPATHPTDWAPLLLRVAITTGARLGEVLGWQWRDFDKDASELRIERQWLRSGTYGPPKTAAGVRTLALPADLRDELIAARLRSPYSQESDPIFASRAGRPMWHRDVTRRAWEPARDLAGLPSSLVFHDLRGACASLLIDAGLDPVTVAQHLGHDDPSVTLKVYASRFNRQAKDDRVRAALAGVVAADA